jgi:putative membrane protein
MQFLKTLFWVVLTVILVLLARANWIAVSLKLWGGLEADVKLPVLILFAFLIGFLPTFILYRARLWSLRRRLDPAERVVTSVSAPVSPAQPMPVSNSPVADRVATDSKAWPTL